MNQHFNGVRRSNCLVGVIWDQGFGSRDPKQRQLDGCLIPFATQWTCSADRKVRMLIFFAKGDNVAKKNPLVNVYLGIYHTPKVCGGPRPVSYGLNTIPWG